MTAALLGLAGVTVTSLVTYLVARRRNSGRIGTSSADSLWEAAEQIRKELRSELERIRLELAACAAKVAQLKELLEAADGG